MVKRNDVRGEKKEEKRKKKAESYWREKRCLGKRCKADSILCSLGEGIFAFCAEDLSHFFTFFFYPSTLTLSPPICKARRRRFFFFFFFFFPFFLLPSSLFLAQHQRPLTVVSFHIFSPLHSNSFASSFLASLPRFFPLSVFQLQRLQRNYRYLGKDEILVVVVELSLIHI